MEFDARLLRPAGGFGRRARLLAAASWVPNAALALGFFAGLLLAPPEHRCRPDPALLPPALRNLSGRALLATAVPRSGAGWSRCLLYSYAPGAARPNRTGPCTRGWHYAPPAAGLSASPFTQWDLVCSDGWKVPLEQTTYLLGWLSGCIALGLTCDRFGRRAAFLFSLVLALPLGIGVALALNYVMLLVLRLLLGAALAGTFLSLYVARLELCDPPHRLMVVMVAGFFWVAGELLLPGLAVLCRQWWLLQGAVTLILALLTTCWGCPSLFPESPRWLLATHQLEKGRRGLRALAEGNGVSLEDEFYSQEHLLAELEPASEGAPLPRYHTLCEVFGTRVIWKNSLILGFTASAGVDHPDALCPGHCLLAGRHHAQRLLCRRAPAHRGQGHWAGLHPGCQHGGQSSWAAHGPAEQPQLLPASRRLRLLRHPLGAQHHAAAGEQGQGPARVPAGRREPATAPALPGPPPQGPAAPALPAQPGRWPPCPGLRPPRHRHQEDAGLPPGLAAAAGAWLGRCPPGGDLGG
ncbi:putative solute carrier family 22 member 31 isoform X2 [Carettochelys insculpta]|uniref:putative solute carrier family 22 member 31 isoform X2 n=1 Tax=Carettochelys insculpta TaxID=44489 RepID=UPI003EB82B03